MKRASRRLQRGYARSTMTLMALLLSAALAAADLNWEPKATEYFFGRSISLPLQEQEKRFDAETGRAGFRFFDGVRDLAVRDGKLTFVLTGRKATLGWGNYGGRLGLKDVPAVWQQINRVKLRVRVSQQPCRWSVRLWRDGERLDATAVATSKSTDWHELQFAPLHARGANPDGLELTLEAEPGTRVEIEWLKLVQPVYEGYCRFEFDLPAGRVWRAVANVGSATYRNWGGTDEMISELHINGQTVERQGACFLYHTAPVDIAPYLKPGRNCVGFYGFRIGYSPFLCFQARIVMASGEVIRVATGPGWKCNPHVEQASPLAPRPKSSAHAGSPAPRALAARSTTRKDSKAAPGWDEPGFNDSPWQPAKLGRGPDLDSRDAARRVGLPAYSGRLVIKRPKRRDLFFKQGEPAVIEVHVPQLGRHGRDDLRAAHQRPDG
ncbi:MAG: hypothetical protein GXP27_16985, partial [Planctomycetes bacterium]|nr:hypothetical protein [Planctomycetota bacterium]